MSQLSCPERLHPYSILEQELLRTRLKDHLPISWATIPVYQHPRARLMSCLRPVLPTYDEHLEKIWNQWFKSLAQPYNFHEVVLNYRPP